MTPSGQKFIAVALALPRFRAGMNSLVAALMAEHSAPTPMAVSRRRTKIDS